MALAMVSWQVVLSRKWELVVIFSTVWSWKKKTDRGRGSAKGWGVLTKPFQKLGTMLSGGMATLVHSITSRSKESSKYSHRGTHWKMAMQRCALLEIALVGWAIVFEVQLEAMAKAKSLDSTLKNGTLPYAPSLPVEVSKMMMRKKNNNQNKNHFF